MKEDNILKAIENLKNGMDEKFKQVDDRITDLKSSMVENFERVDNRLEAIEKELEDVSVGVDMLVKETWDNKKDITEVKMKLNMT